MLVFLSLLIININNTNSKLMKTKSFTGLLILFTVFTSFSAFAQDAVYSGDWKLDRVKTVLADNQLFLAKVDIKIKGDSLLTNRTYENSNGEEYLFAENLSLDNKEGKIVIYDMPRTSKATRSATDKAIILESKTTFYGNGAEDNLIAKEIWKVSEDGKTLSIEFTNKMSEGETSGTLYFSKAK